MPNLNKIIMMGHLTRDPKLSFLPSQTAVCEFGLATGKKYKAQDGSTKEKTCFVDCRIFGKRADAFQKYVKKGDPVYIEGELDFQQWESKEGQKRSKHIILVNDFQFIGGKKQGESQAEPQDSNDDIPF